MRISPVSIRLSRHLTRLPFALAVLLLAAGCHSSRVAYQFAPATSPTATTTAVTTGSGAELVSAPETVVAPVAVQMAPAKPARTQAWPPRQLRQLRRVVTQAVAQQRVPTSATRVNRGCAAQSTRHVARPQQPSEVGLGTTVFGVLGLIVLPISLIGLLIWGGPVWAILAGLAALAILIAYIDPFG